MKSDLVFALEQASWPALLVGRDGTVRHSNSTARELFGPVLSGLSVALATLWSEENPVPAQKFPAEWQRKPVPMATYRFKVAGERTLAFSTAVCACVQGGDTFLLLQLLPAQRPSAAPGDEAVQAHKQKLECALQLARTVALDFNNALTTILGHTSLVLSRMEPNHPFRHSLLEVEKSAARAAEIANDLGAFSRQEREARGQPSGNLNLLLERTVECFRQSGAAENAEWRLILERRLFAARFDEAKMQQAFLKVLENAAQSLQGRGRVTVQTRNVELNEPSQDREVQLTTGAYVCVEITDTGAGIAPEILPRIFEPFFTTKGREHRGLGLAWVYGIVTNHGGGVAVSSQPGVGTSVRVYLPAEGRVVNETGSSADGLTGNQTILVVDDEDLLLNMSQTVLSAYGYRVLTANSGQKALDLLGRSEIVDLVISDLVMPGMGGRELIEHIHRLSPAIRVLCTSGYVWQASQIHEDGYLQKPFTSQDLLRKVKQALAR